MPYPQHHLSASQLQTYLLEKRDFLALTRSHEDDMTAFSFELVCKKNAVKTKVSVLNTGIIMFEPLTFVSGKDIVLSSAIHGNETAPIEMCNALITQLMLGELQVQHRTLFIFGNPASINIGQRFVNENLNSLFSGGHSIDQGQGGGLINKERHRAVLLENTVRSFFQSGSSQANLHNPQAVERFHYDLHTAIRGSKNEKFVVYPYQHNKPWVKTQLQFMLACDINTILFSNSATTTFSYFSANEFDAHAFTVELGKVKPFGKNNMDNYHKVKSSLAALITGQPLALKAYHKDDFNFFEIEQVIIKHNNHFSFHFDEDALNFTDFPVGTVIATDGQQHIITRKKGEAIIFPNANVAVGQRALLTVIPVVINPE